MKRLVCFLCMLLVLVSASGCGSVEPSDDVSTNHSAVSNTEAEIDFSSAVPVEKPGYLPVSTDSIKDILKSTGRFEISEIPQMYVVDVLCELDKTDESNLAILWFAADEDNTTKKVSYNFKKDAVKDGHEDSIRWGLDVLMQILGDELTDDTWSDILAIAEKNESVGAFGTDYEGYANADTGIKLIYADLGNNVQIDIRAVG